jgi:hypothetical protein
MGTKLHICEGLHVILLKEAQLSQNKCNYLRSMALCDVGKLLK